MDASNIIPSSMKTKQFRVTDPTTRQYWLIDAVNARAAANYMVRWYESCCLGKVDYDYFVVVPHNWNVCAQEDDEEQLDIVFDLVSEETQFIKDNLQSLLTMYHGKSVKGVEVNEVLFKETRIDVGVKQTLMGCTSWYVITVTKEKYKQWKQSALKPSINKQYYDEGFKQWTVNESCYPALKKGTIARAFFMMGVHDAKYELEYDPSRIIQFLE